MMASWSEFLRDDVFYCIFYAFLLFFIATFLYHFTVFLKFKIKVSTECWFCMEKNRVCLANKNSWTCIYCLQYNGFSKTGSYNKVIVEQHNFNDVGYCKRSSMENYEQYRLCDLCNKNQEIKVKLLADFIPLDEDYFDKEVNEFRKNLDSLYKICNDCEHLLKKVLDNPNDSNLRKLSNKKSVTIQESPPKMATSGILATACKYWLLLWPIVAHLSILSIIFYLFELSNHSYIFKISANYNYFRKSFSMEYVKTYEQLYFLKVLLIFSLYSLLTYFGKTYHYSIDSITYSLFVALITNHVGCNVFAFSHDTLIEFQQWLFAFLMLATLFNFIFFLYQNFYSNSSNTAKSSDSVFQNKRINNQSKNEKLFNFVKSDDEHSTTNIREQIKDLSLTDFNACLSGHNNLTKSDVNNSGSNFSNPFSTYNFAALTSTNSFPCVGMFTSQNSYLQFKTFDAKMADSDVISSFDQATYMSKGPVNSQLLSLSSKTYHQTHQHRSPRILNYFVNYSNPSQSLSSQTITPSNSSFSNWFSNMLHTFELILFLVIIGMIVAILSMPITLSYNSDFNSFEVNIVVYNMSNN